MMGTAVYGLFCVEKKIGPCVVTLWLLPDRILGRVFTQYLLERILALSAINQGKRDSFTLSNHECQTLFLSQPLDFHFLEQNL